jgi:uncharacterized short protein YbdD (DUF466 family)
VINYKGIIMATKSESAKEKIKKAFNKFQLKGLKSYGKYLEKEFKNSKEKKSKKSYNSYITRELKKNDSKITKITSKLK